MPCLSYTVHLTLYTLHCTPYTVHLTLYTLHFTPYPREIKNIFLIFVRDEIPYFRKQSC